MCLQRKAQEENKAAFDLTLSLLPTWRRRCLGMKQLYHTPKKESPMLGWWGRKLEGSEVLLDFLDNISRLSTS